MTDLNLQGHPQRWLPGDRLRDRGSANVWEVIGRLQNGRGWLVTNPYDSARTAKIYDDAASEVEWFGPGADAADLLDDLLGQIRRLFRGGA